MTGRRGIVVMVLGAAAVVAGCAAQQTKAPESPQKTPSLAMDPCAERLHEIAGLMLQHYATARALPKSLAELKAIDPSQPFTCPTTGHEYAYDPKGTVVPGGDLYGRLVLFDADAPHRGMRWGVAVVEGGAGRPLVTRIIAAAPGGKGATTREADVPWK